MRYKDIKTALESERPNDKIVKILSNKFAIVQSMYENGKFAEISICGLEDQKIFFDHMNKFFIQSGAQRIEPDYNKEMAKFKINTLGGVLNISLYPDQEYTYTVFSQFEDEKRASQICTCNPHSGKYNFHSTLGIGGATEQAEQFFECVFIRDKVKDVANELADIVCTKINSIVFVETYGRQGCLEEVIKILEQRV